MKDHVRRYFHSERPCEIKKNNFFNNCSGSIKIKFLFLKRNAEMKKKGFSLNHGVVNVVSNEKKYIFTLRSWRSERSNQINYFSFDHDV